MLLLRTWHQWHVHKDNKSQLYPIDRKTGLSSALAFWKASSLHGVANQLK